MKAAIVLLLLLLYAAESGAKPRQPYDAKFKGWWAVPVGRRAGWVPLYVKTDRGLIAYDSVAVCGLPSGYVGVLFVAPDSLLRGPHADRSKKARR